MSFTVFLGNLPTWVTADDISSWLTAENLVADHIKVIRNPETQESKGFAFIESPNSEEMSSIIKRFDRAPLEERLLRANPAQPPKGRVGPPMRPPGSGPAAVSNVGTMSSLAPSGQNAPVETTTAADPSNGTTSVAAAGLLRDRNRRGGKKHRRGGRTEGPPSAFAEELAKAL